MAWQQVKNFNIKDMGTRKGWCLMNARLGFGIKSGTFESAKADMLSQKANGTLHPMPCPSNVAVPVYVDSISVYEHIMVCDKGTFYSDGKKVAQPNHIFGWGELCDGVRVVKWVSDSKKTDTEIAKEVIAGKWGNGDDRKNRLTKAGYNYNNIQAIVNKLLSGNTSNKKSDVEIAREVIQGKWGNGTVRKLRLKQAGYNYDTIQSIVNRLLG